MCHNLFCVSHECAGYCWIKFSNNSSQVALQGYLLDYISNPIDSINHRFCLNEIMHRFTMLLLGVSEVFHRNQISRIWELLVALVTFRTQAEIQHALDQVCGIVPSQYKDTCNGLIQQYGPEVIALLINEVEPQTICPQLKLCPTAVVKVGLQCFEITAVSRFTLYYTLRWQMYNCAGYCQRCSVTSNFCFFRVIM